METTGVVDRFLHAIENATIGDCQVWSADARLDATMPNWRLHASGADAIRAEYAKWFADPGHFDELNRYQIERGGGGDGGDGSTGNDSTGNDGVASELIEYTLTRSLAPQAGLQGSTVARRPRARRSASPTGRSVPVPAQASAALPALLAAERMRLDSVHAEVTEHAHSQRLHAAIKPRAVWRRHSNRLRPVRGCNLPAMAIRQAHL